MDLKGYFQKIREAEKAIEKAFPVVISLGTADGGAAGVLTEVTKAIAAKMIVEGAARLANSEEVKEFQAAKAEAKKAAEDLAAAAKLTLSMFSSAEQRLANMMQPAQKQG